MTRFRATGLRFRLLVVFVLVTVLGATAATLASAQSASSALVTAGQERLVSDLQDRIAALAPSLEFPPAQEALDRLRDAVGGDTLVTYRSLRAASGRHIDLITPELRTAVRTSRRVSTQRVLSDGTPWLLIGTPILLTAADGSRSTSGIEVFTVRDLSDVQQQMDRVTLAAGGAAALALPISVLIALLAAGSVLRPVRRLRDTARRLAAGDLQARTPARGADELAELTETMNEMAGALQSSMDSMERMQADAKRFVADVSHELRTPLSTLTAVVEVLDDATRDLPGDARESAQLAIAETRRLVLLVDELMEISRFDAGSERVHLDAVDLGELVASTLRSRGWADAVAFDPRRGVVIEADRRRLDVIVANLAGNALRHGRAPIRIDIQDAPGRVTVTVTDSGPGIPEEVLPHVFDRFYKADLARSRSSGSGLGLAIALENARLHGGTITVDNVSGSGARFTLSLPAPPALPALPEEPAE